MSYSVGRNYCFIWTLLLLLLCTFVITSTERLLLFDDFTDEAHSKSIWTPRHYGVPVGVDDGAGNMVANKKFAMYGGSSEWTDYEVEIKFRLLSENEAGNVLHRLQINVRYDENRAGNQNYQAWINFNPQDPRYGCQCTSWVDGQRKKLKVLADTPLQAFGDTWHTFTARIIKNLFSIYIDGELIHEYEVSGYDKGKIYVYIENLGSAPGDWINVDYIKVREL